MIATDHLDAELRPHVQRGHTAIVARMGDARAHGRLGQISEATQRLIDLQATLMARLADAKADFYRAAFRHHGFDPTVHDPDRQHPTREGMEAARTAPIGESDHRRELALLLEDAQISLLAAMASPVLAPIFDPTMTGPGTTTTAAAIDTWHIQHRDRLRSWAAGAMSDAQMAISAAVNDLRRRPEFRNGG